LFIKIHIRYQQRHETSRKRSGSSLTAQGEGVLNTFQIGARKKGYIFEVDPVFLLIISINHCIYIPFITLLPSSKH
jgi:hypothetical protein